MLRSWKNLGLVMATVAAISVALFGAGTGGPHAVFAAGGNITVNLVDTNPNGGQGIQFTVSGAANCSPNSFSLNELGSQGLTCAANGAVTITVNGNWNLAGTCTMTNAGTTNGQQSSYQGTTATTLPFSSLTDDEQWKCDIQAVSTGTPSATPTATGTPGTATPTVTSTPSATTLTVSVAPSTISCTGSAFVTVVAKDATGAVVAGGTITLSTNLGLISPTSAVDAGAGVLAVLSGNNQGGTATITATANGVTGTGTATINCAAATSTPIPPTAVPQQPSTGVQPPRTGDAGLADRSGSSAAIAAGIVLFALTLAGAGRIVWSRTRS